MKICLSCEGISATEQERCGSCGTLLLSTDAVHYPLRRGEMDAANPLLGTLLDGKYRIVSVLGRGGMGTVYRAVHEVSLVPVALKLLHPRHGSRPEYRRAFLAEARKAGRVVHDHCARVLDVGETGDGTAYLAMELAEGETLEDWTQGGRGLPPGAVVEILSQICVALAAMHAGGLVHRDLSARNVMVAMREGRPRVKVLDFGIAKAAALAGRNGEPDSGGEPAGFANPVYSAPEHLAGRSADPRADLYSLGAIGYLLLSGSPPVAAHDPREAARATLEGRLRPLHPLPGVPRRLQRLIERCLRRDPEARPATAADVLEELTRIRGARRRAVRSGLAALLLAAILLATGRLVIGEVFLRPLPGPLELTERGMPRPASVTTVRSARLSRLRFHFGGFAPERLEVEVSRDGAPLLRRRLEPVVEPQGGALVLANAQPGWREVLEGMVKACAEGPVDLQFVVPGLQPLGSARLLVDDAPPALECSLHHTGDDPAAPALLGATQLECRVRDAGGVDRLVAEVALDDGGTISIDVPAGGSLPLGARLLEERSGVADHGPCRVTVRATDRAGNEAVGEAVRLFRCDLAAPAVEAVTGAAGEDVIAYTGPQATVRLRLSDHEAGLQIRAIAADGSEHLLSDLQPVAAGWLRAVLHGSPEERQPFLSGAFTFAVRDSAGNRTERELTLNFRNRRLDASLVPADGLAAVLASEVVVSPAGAQMEFLCNAAFRLAGAALGGADGLPRSEPLTIAPVRAGRFRVTVPPLPPDSYRLELQVEDGGEGARALAYTLRVLPEKIELRLPAARDRFLPPLLDANLLQRSGAGVRDGPAWSIDPALRPYLRGQLWVGGEVPIPVALPDRSEPGGPLLPDVKPVNGRNLLALELRDVLGRPVVVLLGDRPAETLRIGATEASLIAVFHHHTDPPVVVGEEVHVEPGQPAQLHVRSPLPFEPVERAQIRLGLAQDDLPASAVQPAAGGGTLITFLIPHGTWSAAANLGGLSREDFGRDELFPVDAYLVTPGTGRHDLRLHLRTRRSTLVPVRLGDLGVPPPVPEPLRAIQLMPVLAPGGEFADPVPANLPGRGLFRSGRELAVGGMSDFYLQDRELTRGQYLALTTAFLELPPERRPDWRTLVHACDPLGEGRLLGRGLVPSTWSAAPEQFAAATAAGPDCAVTGVDFFQAYIACRMLGVVLGDDPDLLRLPLGCELELAALGPVRTALHGAAAHGGAVSFEAFRRAGDRWASERSAPTAADCAAAGDSVPTGFGRPFLGLDFGVREWVLDLPAGGDPAAAALLAEWTGNYPGHLARAADLAAGKTPQAELAARLSAFALVRGLPLGDASGLVSGVSGRPLPPSAAPALPPEVPGVVRCEQVRRDGRDLLPGRLDPRLQRTGFRLAGGASFLQRVRGR